MTTRHDAIIPALLLLLLGTACGTQRDRPDSTAHAPAPSPVVRTPAAAESFATPAGYGAVRIGMTVAEAAAALGATRRAAAGTLACGYAPIGGLPAGLRLFVLADTVARIDVDSSGVRTAALVGVGDLESQVIAAYPAAQVGPHKYTGPAGHVVTVTSPGDLSARLVFETDGARVLRYRAGRQPAVDLVEGCG